MTGIDLQILDFIQKYMKNDVLDIIMPLITRLGDIGIVWILLTIILLCNRKTRTVGYVCALSLIIDLLCVDIIIKPLVARSRPFTINTGVALLIDAPHDYSFPSGHTAASFAVVSSLYFSKNKLWKPFLILACLIAFSRLYLYVHFPSDVFAGLLLGICFGKVSSIIMNRYTKNRSLLGTTK
ncbi:MAG: phosphatase PAP2 family protein [Candidatus Saccharibacteria bacterium]|nr:phosphatase PAP2 family protein [Candidatus Saccharibacteria bacterium]